VPQDERGKGPSSTEIPEFLRNPDTQNYQTNLIGQVARDRENRKAKNEMRKTNSADEKAKIEKRNTENGYASCFVRSP
jgi:hypothetical protein